MGRYEETLWRALQENADYLTDYDTEGAWRIEGYFNPSEIIDPLIASVETCFKERVEDLLKDVLNTTDAGNLYDTDGGFHLGVQMMLGIVRGERPGWKVVRESGTDL